MSKHKIRPHHILCITFFEGKGYSKAFCENMFLVKDALEHGKAFTLHCGTDSVCSACPHNQNGICASMDKVHRYDENILHACGLTYNTVYTFQEVQSLALNNIIYPDRLQEVCGGCQWYSICKEKAEKLRKDVLHHETR